jgi:hypothetical protein
MFNKIFAASVFFSILILGMHFCIRHNQGFSAKKITMPLPEKAPWNLSPIACNDKVLKILDQPFKFLGRGGQVFAFESEDEKYVIKFIRFDLLTPTLTMRLNRYFFQDHYSYVKKSKRYFEAMQSYYRSFTELSDLTSTLYAHTVKSDSLNKKIVLTDKLGKNYTLDLNSAGFVLQKKVCLLGDVLVDLQKNGEDIKIRRVLEDYLTVLKKRSDRGYWIKDHNQFLRNYGMVDGRVYEIDVGSYRVIKDEDQAFIQKNNRDHLKRLHLWMEQNMREHLAFFDDKINEILVEN